VSCDCVRRREPGALLRGDGQLLWDNRPAQVSHPQEDDLRSLSRTPHAHGHVFASIGPAKVGGIGAHAPSAWCPCLLCCKYQPHYCPRESVMYRKKFQNHLPELLGCSLYDATYTIYYYDTQVKFVREKELWFFCSYPPRNVFKNSANETLLKV
jgi:hypothetical protein